MSVVTVAVQDEWPLLVKRNKKGNWEVRKCTVHGAYVARHTPGAVSQREEVTAGFEASAGVGVLSSAVSVSLLLDI